MRQPFGLLLLLWAVSSAEGGSLPFEGLDDLRGPYEGTGVSGEAFHVQPLGDAGQWRICAYWSSARTESSPWLGFGWSIPALESRFIPLDERRWAFHQPDGYVRIFVRTGHADGVLHLSGGSAWTAECRGESIRVTADPKDGGPVSRFVFRQGRLVRMSCEEGDFEIKYTGRTADRILSRGKTLLEVVRTKAPDEGGIFKFNGGRSQVVATCLPATVFLAHRDSAPEAVQKKCLASLQTTGGVIPFTYGGEYDEAFFTAGGTRWTWNTYTRKILSCGDWTYAIHVPKHEGEGLLFRRRRRSDASAESYRYSRKTGMLVQVFTNGTRRASQVFTSGPLAYRRVRWMEVTKSDGDSARADYTYDEAGRVVYRRITREGKKSKKDEVWLGQTGRIVRRRVNGEEVPME